MSCRLLGVFACCLSGAGAAGQTPYRDYTEAVELRYSPRQPVVSYRLRVDSADRAAFQVEIRLRNLPDTVLLAMAAHPEYDDRYWRYVEGLEAWAEGRLPIERLDSALWRLVPGGDRAVVRYRIRLPDEPSGSRAAWRPFVAGSGALVGGPHAFMYVVGAGVLPSHLHLELPPGWRVATGLTPTADPATFFAPSIEALMESPVLVGHFRSWIFHVDAVPHRVVYWPAGAASFDSTAFVAHLERLVREAVRLFGRPPYRDYTFIFQDSAWGGLEHPSSVTLGIPASLLAQDPGAEILETAHEFVHTWNLMRIRPEEYGPVSHRTQPPTAGLWFSEGLTMFYADLLLRRAGLPAGDPTREGHLAGLIERYLASPGNARFSAEQVSRVAYNAPPGALGDYTPSAHLQGELIGAMLDLVIRRSTGGRRSMDDVMRTMLERFSGPRGFNGGDVEQVVGEICRCSVRSVFDGHVRGAGTIDFNRYLAGIGRRAVVRWVEARDREGRPAPDRRVWAMERPEGGIVLQLSDPEGAWGRARLHTGDRVTAVNGVSVRTWPEFRAVVGRLGIGDTAQVEVLRPEGPWRTTVRVTGYLVPEVTVEVDPAAPAAARALGERWAAGMP